MDRASPSSTDHAGVMVPPPLIYVAFFVAGLGMQRYIPVPRVPFAIGSVAGAVFLLGFLALTVWSFRRFWTSRTTILPMRPTTALVAEGPYRWTRNPMYLGLLLLYTGVACWFGLVWPLLLAPILVWMITVSVIGREERYLTRKFGDEYRRYQARVRRWI